MGIGHKIKSVTNPDMRVTIMVSYVKKHFAQHPVLDYALEVEKLTTKKKANLILNVDGVIACAFVDLIRGCGMFEPEEVRVVIVAGLSYRHVVCMSCFLVLTLSGFCTGCGDCYKWLPEWSLCSWTFDWFHRSLLGPKALEARPVQTSMG